MKPEKYHGVCKLLKDEKPSTVFEDARRQLDEESAKSIFPPSYKYNLRQAQNWSFLAHQVVGGEVPYEPEPN